jgi:UDP-N-acetylglucosamine--N-acetylmuramyl-(pentapeptide) pyrophosphoryl-undecaprenol N-acetylglucosamine transferase
VNADFLVKHGAAVMLEDDKLSNHLLPTVRNLLSQPQKLASMREAMRNLSRPQAAVEIGQQIFALCQQRS